MSFARLVHRLKEGFAAPPPGPEQQKRDPLLLATAAVLLEIGHADGSLSPAEGVDLETYLQRAFTLSADEAGELIDEATEIRNQTIDHFALTNFIRRNASLQDRIDIVKTMWRMVYSDGRLTNYENYLVRKLADLLGLEHHVMIEAKVAVLRDMGKATP